MKKVIILLVSLVWMIGVMAQGCLPEGIIFTSQYQIDNFQTNYPGCTEIEGAVNIGGPNGSNITNLFGLSSITKIDGYFSIFDNDNLTTLAGLENLEYVGEELQIDDNDSLINLTGLENLNSILSLYIEENNSLISLTGLNNLISIVYGLHIGGVYPYVGFVGNPLLTTLSGLDNLNSIGAEFVVIGNTTLTSLAGLEALETIGGYISISNNSSLSECDVQSVCEYLINSSGEIYIEDNSDGCNSPEEVEEHCLTAIEEQNNGKEIKIIPNPSNDIITISSPAITGNNILSIFNVSGEKVMERPQINTETQIDISTLPRGVYFVQLQNEKMVEVGKMVKE
jgi:hypothetical protein